MQSHHQVRDFNPLFILLQRKDWSAAMKALEENENCAFGCVKIKGFYDAPNTAQHSSSSSKGKVKSKKDKKKQQQLQQPQTQIKTNVNALHIACNNNAPLMIIEALLGGTGAPFKRLAAEKESTYKRLPLHIATLKQCPSRIVATLVGKFPSACRVKDKLGRLPIHYASKDRRHGRLVLRYLLKVYPQSVKIQDDKGFLPIHVACRSGMPLSIIKLLLQAAPETILSTTNNGATPIHCAKSAISGGMYTENDDDIVQTLASIAKETKEILDRDGDLNAYLGGDNSMEEKSYDSSSSSTFWSDFSGLLKQTTATGGGEQSGVVVIPDEINFDTGDTVSLSDEGSSFSSLE